MVQVPRYFRYVCSNCGGGVRRKLCDDFPGLHTYIWACDQCHKEYGSEWLEYHHGAKELPPDLELQPWSENIAGL